MIWPAAVVFAILVTLACSPASGGASPPPVRAPARAGPQELPVKKAPACLEQLEVDQGSSVLSEQRSVGPALRDFQERYAAAVIDPAKQQPVAAVKGYRIDGTPLLWFDAGRTAAVVNAAFLSDLTVADPTRMSAGTEVELGRLTRAGLGKLGGRELVRFLILSRAIATYWHIGATLCLVEEREDAAGYRARFTGEHTYFTNEKNTQRFAFDVTVDPGGIIRVLAGP